MRFKVDLHVHTTHSHDSCLPAGEALRRARMLGLSAVAFTDHDSMKVHENPPAADGLTIIRGVEVSSREGHILGLGLAEPVRPGLPAAETVDRIRSAGGVAIVAHVMRMSKTTVRAQIIRELRPDCLETLNASTLLPSAYRNARALARQLGLPQTGGSDAHVPSTVGKAFTLVEAESADEDGLLKAIRLGRVNPQGEGEGLLGRLLRAKFILRKKLRG